MKLYKNLKIRLKFIICFGIISILVFLLGAMGIKTINLTNNNYKTSINSNNQAVTMGI